MPEDMLPTEKYRKVHMKTFSMDNSRDQAIVALKACLVFRS